MSYPERWIKARNPWLVGHRPRDIRGVMIHATRSGHTDGDDGPGTENWMANPNNQGAAYDALTWEDGTRIIAMDWDNDEAPLWAAGFGDGGTWAAQDYYIQWEVAQGRIEDTYSEDEIRSTAEAVAALSKRYDFPLIRLPYLTQTGDPPRGITAHDACANGKRLGKSDPGYMFPWDHFLELATSYLEEEMSPENQRKLDAVFKALTGSSDATEVWDGIDGWNQLGNSLLGGYTQEQKKLRDHIDNHSAGVSGPVGEHSHEPGKVRRP